MKLRTEITLSPSGYALDHGAKIMTLGSCFSAVAGNYLLQRKFTVKNNPFGTLYNVKSLCDVLAGAVDGVPAREDRAVSRDGLFFHLDYHSSFWSDTREGLLQRITETGREVREFLREADLLIITLGTARVYRYKGEAVSNCHKLPAVLFTQHLLEPAEQSGLLHRLVKKVRELNPGLKLVFTVSPVRHIKDGIAENSLSKALLRVLCEEAVNSFENTWYFPSFEMMMDDLRDYRFYQPDLIHPDEVAENYICSLFSAWAVSPGARKLGEDWTKVRQALEHRPLNPSVVSQRPFLLGLLEKIESFSGHFDVREEREEVKRRLAALAENS